MSTTAAAPPIAAIGSDPLEWQSSDTFKIKDYLFQSSHFGAERKDAEAIGAFWIMKNPELLAL
ncbi:MAG: hypothetical protein LW848_14960, partial [Hyphomonadaceae bacterium]|nr:hypothetical protein [Hyphomonadaceae bacterium]